MLIKKKKKIGFSLSDLFLFLVLAYVKVILQVMQTPELASEEKRVLK